MSESEPTSPQRRRRRRRPRSGGRGATQQSASSVSQPKSKDHLHTNSGAKTTPTPEKSSSTTAKRKRTASTPETKQTPPTTGARSRRARGRRGRGAATRSAGVTAPVNANKENTRSAKSPAAQRRGRKRPQRTNQRSHRKPRLTTSIETSAGGLVLRGMVDSVDTATAINTAEAVDFGRLSVALIGRLDRRGRMLWSMPKGHIEAGETKAQTAVREIHEETGIRGTVLTELGDIDYWFVAEGKRIHKTVHHHILRFDSGQLSDTDPEVTEVAWVPFEELPSRLSYPDERRLVDVARNLLTSLAWADAATTEK